MCRTVISFDISNTGLNVNGNRYEGDVFNVISNDIESITRKHFNLTDKSRKYQQNMNLEVDVDCGCTVPSPFKDNDALNKPTLIR